MMRKILGGLCRLMEIGCIAVVLLVVALAIVLFAAGAIDGARVKAAFAALQGRMEEKPEAGAAAASADWKEIQKVRRQMELTQRTREADLKTLNDMARNRLVQIELERQRLERERIDAEKRIEEARKAEEEWVRKKTDAVAEANLPIYEKLEPERLLDLMEFWKVDEIVKYLRLMKPAKSAKVVEAMQADARFQVKIPAATGPTIFQQVVLKLQ